MISIKKSILNRFPQVIRNQSLLTWSIFSYSETIRVSESKSFKKSDKIARNQEINDIVSDSLGINKKTFIRKQSLSLESIREKEYVEKLLDLKDKQSISPEDLKILLLNIKLEHIRNLKRGQGGVSSILNKNDFISLSNNVVLGSNIARLFNIPNDYRKSSKTYSNEEFENIEYLNLYSETMENHPSVSKKLKNESNTEIDLLFQQLQLRPGTVSIGINDIKLIDQINTKIYQSLNDGENKNISSYIRNYWYCLLRLKISEPFKASIFCSRFEKIYEFWMSNYENLKQEDKLLAHVVSEFLLHELFYKEELVNDHYLILLDKISQIHSKIVASDLKYFNQELMQQKILDFINISNQQDKNSQLQIKLLKSIAILSLGSKSFMGQLENILIYSDHKMSMVDQLEIAISFVRSSSGRKFVKTFLQAASQKHPKFDINNEIRMIYMMSHSNIVFNSIISKSERNFLQYCSTNKKDDAVMLLYSLIKIGYSNKEIINQILLIITSGDISSIHRNKWPTLFWSLTLLKSFDHFYMKLLESLINSHKNLPEQALAQFSEAYLNTSEFMISKLSKEKQNIFLESLKEKGYIDLSENLRKPKIQDALKKTIINSLSQKFETKTNVWRRGFFFDIALPSEGIYIDFDDAFSKKQDVDEYLGSINWKSEIMKAEKNIKYFRLSLDNVKDLNSDFEKLCSYLGIN